jgi:hypothetical protein
MEREGFYEAVSELLLELRPDLEPPGADTHLWAEGYLDSFAMIRVLVQLEELVGHELELGPDALPSFYTMGTMYDTYVAGRS